MLLLHSWLNKLTELIDYKYGWKTKGLITKLIVKNSVTSIRTVNDDTSAFSREPQHFSSLERVDKNLH